MAKRMIMLSTKPVGSTLAIHKRDAHHHDHHEEEEEEEEEEDDE